MVNDLPQVLGILLSAQLMTRPAILLMSVKWNLLDSKEWQRVCRLILPLITPVERITYRTIIIIIIITIAIVVEVIGVVVVQVEIEINSIRFSMLSLSKT